MNQFQIEKLSTEQQDAIVQRIHFLRNDVLHMNQKQFSNMLDISQTYISLLESGERPLSTTLAVKIIASFHINPSWLIYGNDSEDIFSISSTTENGAKHLQIDALNTLVQMYSLKSKDVAFLQWYLSLSANERLSFIDALDSIVHLYPDN